MGKLAVVLAVALALRLGGITFGLPYQYHADEWAIVNPAIETLRTGDPNPHWFHYPSLYIHLQTGVVWLAGKLASLRNPPLAGQDLRGWIHLFGRAATALIGTATVLVVYLTGSRLWNRRAGTAAAAVLAVTHLHVVHSQYITTDVPSAFFTALCLLLSVSGLSGGRARWFVAAGAAAGLAAATKYNAGLALIVPLSGWLVQARAREDRRLQLPVLIALAALIAYLVGMPWALLDFEGFRGGLEYDLEHYRTGHDGYEGSDSWLYYLRYLVGTGLTPALFVAVAVGWILLVNRERRRALVLSLFPALYYLLLSLQRVRFERNLMPLIPWLALFGGYALHAAWSAVRRGSRTECTRVAAYVALLVLTIGWPLGLSIRHDLVVVQPDTRTIAARWIADNLPPDAPLCLDAYSPPVPADRPQAKRYWNVADQPLDHYRSVGCEYLVVSSLMYQRYLDAPDVYPEDAAMYRDLFGTQELVAEFTGTPAPWHDPVIRIYRLLPGSG